MKIRRRNSKANPTALPLGFVVALGLASPAIADAIDGQWCDPKGKFLKIDGPSITTPGGTKMTGAYDRHSFTYTIPAKEPNAGKKVYMTLNSEEEMDVHVGSPVAKPVRWKRCQTIS